MRHSRFWSWLDDATSHPVLEALKTAVAALLLLALLAGVGQGVWWAWRDSQQRAAHNERRAKELGLK